MNVYEVKLVNRTHGVTVKQRISAPNGDEALRFVVKQQNDFLGVDYDPELDPDTLVVITKVNKEKSYKVTFYYTLEVTASDEDEAEDIAWDIFHEETDSSNFVASVEENE